MFPRTRSCPVVLPRTRSSLVVLSRSGLSLAVPPRSDLSLVVLPRTCPRFVKGGGAIRSVPIYGSDGLKKSPSNPPNHPIRQKLVPNPKRQKPTPIRRKQRRVQPLPHLLKDDNSTLGSSVESPVKSPKQVTSCATNSSPQRTKTKCPSLLPGAGPAGLESLRATSSSTSMEYGRVGGGLNLEGSVSIGPRFLQVC